MKKTIVIIGLFFSLFTMAQEADTAQLAGTTEAVDSTQLRIDEIENSLVYQTGTIELESGNATIKVPTGFQFLDKAQSMYVLTDLWGNPVDSSIIGMLLPLNKGVLRSESWAFTISFDEMGYVKDDDADDIDYDDLLEEQRKDFAEANPERIKLGYQPIEFIGWASVPFYDKNKKVLHWAKELKFGEDSLHTLNYNLRVLGRKGIFMLNAIATMKQLPEVKQNIGKVISSVTFKDGHKYSDYIPDVDNVAAWTIGGLVAGKLLAKVGLLAVIAKFGKLILLGIAAAGGAVWKFIKGRRGKKEEEETVTEPEKKEEIV